jgi:arginyl-tRNA synthetase
MPDIPITPLDTLRAAVAEAVARAAGGPQERVADTMTLERPKRAEFGDYSTNAALLLAPGAGRNPRELAQEIGDELAGLLGEQLGSVDVAGPGFVNLSLADGWLRAALAGVLEAGGRFGAGAADPVELVNVEFISANPTGPMHVGHARNAAYGDALARMLEFEGHRVEREFYVNDAGTQIARFGASLKAAASGLPVPEDGYHGDYIPELAGQIPGAAQMDETELGRAAVALMITAFEQTLADFAVLPFDHWSYESALHDGSPSPVDDALELLAQQGRTYERDGALWLRTTEFGDDKDRVLVRSSGEHTYFASDIAYHEAKRARGFERQIDIWGADHHGYLGRMRAAFAALGGDPTKLEMLIMQLVHLVSSGERSQMSKRAGEFVTVEELVEMVGVDAARWFLLARSHETPVELVVELARQQSSENPVYYVQYAHARIASLLDRIGEVEVRAATEPEAWAGGEPLHPSERLLVMSLLAFPGEFAEAMERRAVHRVASYALELAQTFTAFYRDCRVIDAEPAPTRALRISLSLATMRLLERCLWMLGVGAPRQM